VGGKRRRKNDRLPILHVVNGRNAARDGRGGKQSKVGRGEGSQARESRRPKQATGRKTDPWGEGQNPPTRGDRGEYVFLREITRRTPKRGTSLERGRKKYHIWKKKPSRGWYFMLRSRVDKEHSRGGPPKKRGNITPSTTRNLNSKLY